jgi:uncharacterized Zn finger protein
MNLFDPSQADKAIDRAWAARPIRLRETEDGFEIEGKHGTYRVEVQEVNGRFYYTCTCPARTTCWHCIQPVAMIQRRAREVEAHRIKEAA